MRFSINDRTPPHRHPARLEQRRKLPDAPARAYLTVIEKDLQAIARLLAETAA